LTTDETFLALAHACRRQELMDSRQRRSAELLELDVVKAEDEDPPKGPLFRSAVCEKA
jgi:hypothetical protein